MYVDLFHLLENEMRIPSVYNPTGFNSCINYTNHVLLRVTATSQKFNNSIN